MMKAKITITDSHGTVYEGEVELVVSTENPRRGSARSPVSASTRVDAGSPGVDVDFSLPVRAFMNRYAKGCTGPEVFALLVARLAGGEVGQEVRVNEISSEWNRMSGILGTFATVYGTRAKNEAWVDSPGRGVFALLPDWKGALRTTR